MATVKMLPAAQWPEQITLTPAPRRLRCKVAHPDNYECAVLNQQIMDKGTLQWGGVCKPCLELEAHYVTICERPTKAETDPDFDDAGCPNCGQAWHDDSLTMFR